MLEAPQSVQHLSAKELLELAAQLIGQIADKEQIIAAQDREIHYRQAKIDKLTYEIAHLKRHKFGKRAATDARGTPNSMPAHAAASSIHAATTRTMPGVTST